VVSHPKMRLFRAHVDKFIAKTLDSDATSLSSASKSQSLAKRVRDFLSGLEIGLKTNAWCREKMSLDSDYGTEVAAEGLERCVTSRLTARIFNRSRKIRAKDQKLWRRMRVLQFVTPSHLDVAPCCLDAKLLDKCCAELLRIDSFSTPADKLMCVVRTCQFIFDILSAEHKSGKSKTPPGADDFFPPFVYVVLRARVPRLHAHIEYIRNYRRQEDLIGKNGYCFINLCSAVAFLENLTASQLTIDPETFDECIKAAKARVESEDRARDAKDNIFGDDPGQLATS